MTTVLAHESELEFELGGPAYRLMQRIGLIRGGGPSLEVGGGPDPTGRTAAGERRHFSLWLTWGTALD